MKNKSISILGGTGKLGLGLARRLAIAGYPVTIGSRSTEKAQAAVDELLSAFPNLNLLGKTNREAAESTEISILTVPFTHQLIVLEEVGSVLDGKLLVDATVALVPPKVGTVQLPEEGSAAQCAQSYLGDKVRVVSAFQNVSADLLRSDADIECDVLVSGNEIAAREEVIKLIETIGMRGWHAGPIANAAAAEALTSVLIQINRQHEIEHAGIRIVGQS